MRKKQPDWDKFHQWERKYELERLRKLAPIEKIMILDDLYKIFLKIRQAEDAVSHCPRHGGENG